MIRSLRMQPNRKLYFKELPMPPAPGPGEVQVRMAFASICGYDMMMLRAIRAAFAMRRKTLANNLTAAFAMPREEAAALIESLGLDARVRGEALSIAQLAALSDKLSAR